MPKCQEQSSLHKNFVDSEWVHSLPQPTRLEPDDRLAWRRPVFAATDALLLSSSGAVSDHSSHRHQHVPFHTTPTRLELIPTTAKSHPSSSPSEQALKVGGLDRQTWHLPVCLIMTRSELKLPPAPVQMDAQRSLAGQVAVGASSRVPRSLNGPMMNSTPETQVKTISCMPMVIPQRTR